MNERHYVKVYREIIEDERFETIYPSNRNLATWLRMLLLADAMYPAPAPLAGFSRVAVAALSSVKCGLIERVGVGHYRVHGLQAEREAQEAWGRQGAEKRWGPHKAPDRDPNATIPYHPIPSQPNPVEPALAAYQAVAINVSPGALRFLDDLIGAYGQEATARAIGEASKEGRTNLLSRAKSILALRARDAEHAERKDEEQRVVAKRAPDPAVAQLAVALQERQAQKDADWATKHPELVH
jgi:hypothetical protein